MECSTAIPTEGRQRRSFGNGGRRRNPCLELVSELAGILTVTDLNDFNGPAQTTNLGVRSSNLFGRAKLPPLRIKLRTHDGIAGPVIVLRWYRNTRWRSTSWWRHSGKRRTLARLLPLCGPG